MPPPPPVTTATRSCSCCAMSFSLSVDVDVTPAFPGGPGRTTDERTHPPRRWCPPIRRGQQLARGLHELGVGTLGEQVTGGGATAGNGVGGRVHLAADVHDIG